MRPCDIDRTGKIWIYQPSDHKNAYPEMERLIVKPIEDQKLIKVEKTPGEEGKVDLTLQVEEQNRKVKQQTSEIETLKEQNDSFAERLKELEATVKSLAEKK